MFGFLKNKTDTKRNSQPLKSDPSLQEETDSSENLTSKESEKPLSAALTKTRQGFWGRLKSILPISGKFDPESLAQIEEVLISTDIGVKTSSELIELARVEFQSGREVSEDKFREILKKKIIDILQLRQSLRSPKRMPSGPLVILVIGVNGVGKTTTIGKLAKSWAEQGSKVLLCAADTFRAAAVEQLRAWGEKSHCKVIYGPENSKPATVVFDAMKEGQENQYDSVIIDTAGRLHNKANLMSELEGINNSIKRHRPEAPQEVLLVVDGSTGQNALQQAREFNQICPLTGIIVTKLDGTAKGGIVIAIAQELKIPICFIGVGEGVADLRAFDPIEFTEALFSDVHNFSLDNSAEISANAQIRVARRNKQK